MFIDEQGFYSGPRPIEPSHPPRARQPVERTLTLLVLALMLLVLILPVSAAGLVDLYLYLRR